MSKSSGRSLFGSHRSTPITVIEAPVSARYRRRAVIAFLVVAGTVGLLAATVASHYTHPILGLLVGALIGAVCGLLVAAFIAAWPVLRVFWHWAPEITLSAGLVYGWQALMQTTALAASLVVVVLVVGVPAAVGPIRRRIVAWAWCLIVRHRLRMSFASFTGATRYGPLPLILPARPTPAGERVWVWLRPGLSLHDLEAEGQTQRLAVACWANEVRVVRASRRYAALIRVDITRRDPLTDTVTSPLPDYLPADLPDNAPISPAVAPAGLDLPDVPDQPPAAPTPLRGRKPRTPDTNSTYTVDNSDYA
jgi:MFS family permease